MNRSTLLNAIILIAIGFVIGIFVRFGIDENSQNKISELNGLKNDLDYQLKNSTLVLDSLQCEYDSIISFIKIKEEDYKKIIKRLSNQKSIENIKNNVVGWNDYDRDRFWIKESTITAD